VASVTVVLLRIKKVYKDESILKFMFNGIFDKDHENFLKISYPQVLRKIRINLLDQISNLIGYRFIE
jgi:hypothetical protein